MIIYFWGEAKLQKKIARNLQLSKETVGRVVRMINQVHQQKLTSIWILWELYAIELPWDEVLPTFLVQWVDVFSKAHNVVKEIMLPPILTALSGLIAPETRHRVSAIEEEPLNLFTIVLHHLEQVTVRPCMLPLRI